MMQIQHLLAPERTLCKLEATSKKAILATASRLLHQSQPQLDELKLFDAYVERERLGSTALGHGVAIPHIRSNTVENPIACMLQLKNGVEFGAEDLLPVDLVFALIVPENKPDLHLQVLSQIARYFNQESNRFALRNASDSDQLYQILLHDNVDSELAV